MNTITKIKELLNEDLEALNKLIIDNFKVGNELIEKIALHIINGKGKRLRPLLTILCSKMLGHNKGLDIKLAAAIEMIHVATLLHDDVIDNSKMRRFAATANFLWGDKASILVGDYMFSKAFMLMVETNSIDALTLLSLTSSKIVEGETKQLNYLHQNGMMNLDMYFNMIHDKTALLFSAAAEVGAIITQNHSLRERMQSFGKNIGMMYQVIDDYLDYFGKDLGKNIGVDLSEGKITIPIILVYEKVTTKEQNYIKSIFFDKQTDNSFDEVLHILNKYNIAEEVNAIINDIKIKAEKDLISISPNKHEAKVFQKSLFELLEFLSTRTF